MGLIKETMFDIHWSCEVVMSKVSRKELVVLVNLDFQKALDKVPIRRQVKMVKTRGTGANILTKVEN